MKKIFKITGIILLFLFVVNCFTVIGEGKKDKATTKASNVVSSTILTSPTLTPLVTNTQTISNTLMPEIIKTLKPAENIIQNSGLVDNNIIEKQTESYVGNLKTKKFHKSSCSKLPSDGNRIYFKNRDEAINTGYDPCKICHP
jgi:hypothetical protein